ncbi:MAG: hypothetical protein ACJ79H_22445 [Myxococcales bacterium]
MSHTSAALGGSWTHSFEEDAAGVQVYRPTHSFAFPPSRRGREILEFGDEGKVAMGAPGPDDRPRFTHALMTPLGMNRYGLGGTADPPAGVIEIVEATPEVLKLRFV